MTEEETNELVGLIKELSAAHILKHLDLIEDELGKQRANNVDVCVALSVVFNAALEVCAITADMLYDGGIDKSRLSEHDFLEGAVNGFMAKYKAIKDRESTNQDLE